MKFPRKHLLAIGVAAALGAVSIAGPVQAEPAEPHLEAEAIDVQEPANELPPADGIEGFECAGFIDDWQPSDEELAEINAETDDLVAFLAENGVTVEVETDEFGFTYPVFDDDTPDSTWELMDQFYMERYPDEFGELGDEWVPTAEELAQANEETDALVAFMAENGVTIEVETDELGFTYPLFDDDTPEATWLLADEFYMDLYGEELIDGEFEGCDFEDIDWEPTPEELAEINAETDALVAFLAENGVTVEIETDEFGFTYPVFDDDTPESTWELLDEFYMDRYPDDFGDCELPEFEDIEGDPLPEPTEGN